MAVVADVKLDVNQKKVSIDSQEERKGNDDCN